MTDSRKSSTPSVRRLSSGTHTVPHSLTPQLSDPSSTALLCSRSSPFLQKTDPSTLVRLVTPPPSINSSFASGFYDTFSNDSMVICGPYDPGTNPHQLGVQTKAWQQGKTLVYEKGKKFYPHPRSEPVHLTPYECFINRLGTPISCQLLSPSSPVEKSMIDNQPKHDFTSRESPHLPSIVDHKSSKQV